MFQIWYDIYDASNLFRLDEEHDWWDQGHVHDINSFVNNYMLMWLYMKLDFRS